MQKMARRIRGMQELEVVNGWTCLQWYNLFQVCHDSNLDRIEWPDGGCYFDQDADLAEIFSIIKEEIGKYLKGEMKRQQEKARGRSNRVRN